MFFLEYFVLEEKEKQKQEKKKFVESEFILCVYKNNDGRVKYEITYNERIF